MDVDHPEHDQRWDEDARHESPTERLDRNWNSLLQELRVTQTGAQLVTGFLLTLPFQQRFDTLSHHIKLVYLGTVACSMVATLLLVAPVAMHRVLFRQRRLVTLVSVTHRFAISGVALLGIALVGVTIVIFAAVEGTRAGWIVGGFTAAVMIGLWMVLPIGFRLNDDNSPGQH
jgi:hypothetical protein